MASNISNEFVEAFLDVPPRGQLSNEFVEAFVDVAARGQLSNLFVEVFLVPGTGKDPQSGFVQGSRLCRSAVISGRRLVPRKDYRF